MSDIYDRAKATAARMLARRKDGGKGTDLLLQRITRGGYDPATSKPIETIRAYDGSGFRENYKQSDIDGSVIKQGDVRILVSPVLLDGTDMPQPQSQDRILFAGERYTVHNVEPWNYAGLAVGFSVQARK